MTEQITEIDTLVVGAGQAGVAMSEHLTRLDIPHLVLEKQGIAQAWRSGRWDSLVANGPAWHDRFPGMVFPDCPPDSFVGKEQVADYFAAYARSFNAPIRTGVEVYSAERLAGRPGFRVDTSQGVIEAQRIVAATGPFQRPAIPAIAPQSPAIQQLHSAHYLNPQQLPEGGVLVVGPDPPASRLPMSCSGPDARCGCRWGRTTGRRVAIASAIFAGGSGCWECGTPRPMRRGKSMSLSR